MEWRHKYNRKSVRWLIPWYVNGSLPEDEQKSVAEFINTEPALQARIDECERISLLVNQQPTYELDKAGSVRILDSILAQPQIRPRYIHRFAIPLAIAIVLLLWMIIQPGIVLRWSVQSEPINTFRVYRTTADSTQYLLISELNVPESNSLYQYVDTALLPWQSYTYVIQGFKPDGILALSQSVTSRAIEVLPVQLFLLGMSVYLGYMGALVFQNMVEMIRRGNRFSRV